jgi:hypothetical protein
MPERVAETRRPVAQEPARAPGRTPEPVADVWPVHDFAQVPVLQRQPVLEDPALRTRRLAAADAARGAAERIQRALRGGLLWPLEAAEPGGVAFGAPNPRRETFTERATRLRQLAISLGQLASDLEHRILTPERLSTEFPDGASYEPGGPQLRQDLLILYTRWEIERRGGKVDPWLLNTFYIETEPLPTPQAPRAFTTAATEVDLIIVPDVENAPLTYQRVTGFEGRHPKGTLVRTVWEDQFGYFYNRKGRKFYLPGRP